MENHTFFRLRVSADLAMSVTEAWLFRGSSYVGVKMKGRQQVMLPTSYPVNVRYHVLVFHGSSFDHPEHQSQNAAKGISLQSLHGVYLRRYDVLVVTCF